MKAALALLLAGLLITHADEPAPVIRMAWEAGGPVARKKADPNPGLLFAAWDNGKIVWSRDQEKGGEPFFTAQLTPAKIGELLERWAKIAELSNPKFQRFYSGPDSSFLDISLRLKGQRVTLDSWHEGFERDPHLVALPGITSLNGQKREDALKRAPADFLRFREIWKEIRDSTAALIPGKGEPFDQAVPEMSR